MSELLIGLVGLLVGATSARGAARMYRRRWLTATGLLHDYEAAEAAGSPVNASGNVRAVHQEGGTFVQHGTINQVHLVHAAPSGLTDRQLQGLPAWARVKMEEDRLDKGLRPRDPLTNLPAWAVVKIEEARAQ